MTRAGDSSAHVLAELRSEPALRGTLAASVATPRRILFVGKNHLPYVGGSEVSTHHLAAMLDTRGHSITVLARLPRRSAVGVFDAIAAAAIRRPRLHHDTRLGYRTVRAIRPRDALRFVLETIRPEAVVVTCGDPMFAEEVLRGCREYPTLLYVRDAVSAVAASAGAHFDVAIANSNFVRQSLRRVGSESVFLPSLFPLPAYDVPTTREKVLFVNPSPRKGLDIALHLAASRPDVPFVFALSWRQRASALRSLRRAARRLGNVEIRAATTDTRSLFRDCRFVLMPTQYPEAWGRVVSEAQIGGIPSVASGHGGLPEAVGPGGILVSPPSSKPAWLEALSNLWDDEELYRKLSASAVEHSRRDEISVDVVIRRFEGLIARAIDRHSRCEGRVPPGPSVP